MVAPSHDEDEDEEINEVIIAGLFGGIALLGVSGVAYAGTAYESFDTVLPVGQFAGWTTSQTKAYNNTPGQISISSVGSSYEVDAQMCTNVPTNCGAKVYYLNDGDFENLPNSYASGTTVRMQMQISTWNSVKVQVIGSWRSQ
ncbi:hypothetical protein [Luethyella okanaganae]|uniref:Uncharacterized protein n=1 Tax=Luethyella okanaganae TaxID=69372 RepID=A0ABW1VGQ9_9MICO